MKKDFASTIGEKLSIPSEVIGNAPFTEVRGKRSVCIENHGGILEYTEEEIKVNVRRGTIAVHGSNLKIACMNRRRIEIRGNLQAIILE